MSSHSLAHGPAPVLYFCPWPSTSKRLDTPVIGNNVTYLVVRAFTVIWGYKGIRRINAGSARWVTGHGRSGKVIPNDHRKNPLRNICQDPVSHFSNPISHFVLKCRLMESGTAAGTKDSPDSYYFLVKYTHTGHTHASRNSLTFSSAPCWDRKTDSISVNMYGSHEHQDITQHTCWNPSVHSKVRWLKFMCGCFFRKRV